MWLASPRGWWSARRFSAQLDLPDEVGQALAPSCPKFELLLQELALTSDEDLSGPALLRLTLLLFKHGHRPDL